MTFLANYIQTPQVGKFYAFTYKGKTWTEFGTVLEVTPKWIRIEGFKGTRDGWVLREKLQSFYCPSSIPIISQMFDH